MSILQSLPDGSVSRNSIETLREHEKVERIEKVLEFSGKMLSFVIQIGETSYGVHSDHETGDWSVVAEGTDFEETLEEHQEWLDEMLRKIGL